STWSCLSAVVATRAASKLSPRWRGSPRTATTHSPHFLAHECTRSNQGEFHESSSRHPHSCSASCHFYQRCAGGWHGHAVGSSLAEHSRFHSRPSRQVACRHHHNHHRTDACVWRNVGRFPAPDSDRPRSLHRLRGFELLLVFLLVRRRGAGLVTPGFEVPLHRSLTEPILLAGAPRALAIVNGTVAAALGLGLRMWIAGILLWAAGHTVAVFAAKRDPDFAEVLRRRLRQKAHLSC